METSAMARVQLVSSPINLPGYCAVCTRAVHEDGFADPALNIEWHGSLYFCKDCVLEMGMLFGFITPEQYAALKTTLVAQEEELTTLRSSVERLERHVDSLSYERLISRGHAGLPVNAGLIAPDDAPDVSESDELPFDADEFLAGISDSGEQQSTEPTEPVNVEGPDDTSEPTDDNTGLGITL